MPVTLLGFSWDASASYARGPAHGPAIIRSLIGSDASSPYALNGVDIREAIVAEDFSPLPAEPVKSRAAIKARTAKALEVSAPLSLGGDHSVTYPILCAMRDLHGPLNILHIDAHTDLYDAFEGDRYSHASPFARAIEDKCVNALIQVGLRSVGPAERAFGERNGVVMLGADELGAIPFDRFCAPLYVSIDLDGLDPAYAPGVSHPEPGGLSTRDVLSILKRLPAAPVGADIVEYNPERDVGLLTAHAAARLAKELAAAMA